MSRTEISKMPIQDGGKSVLSGKDWIGNAKNLGDEPGVG
jgi:hypothetical protein